MRDRAKSAVLAGIVRALERAGYEGMELELARLDSIQWAKARMRALTDRVGVVAGRAVVISGVGKAALRPIERSLAGPGEVTVEVLVSSISVGTERAQWLRLPNAQMGFPYTPGYSGVGRVLASGDGPDRVPPGTLVAISRLPHASVATLPAAWASVVPDGVAIEDAALVYLAVISGYGVERAGNVTGEPMCVVGAGPIGALAQRLAMLDGPSELTVVAATRAREADALGAGASRFMTADDAPAVSSIGAAAVIEATGDPRGFATAVAAARPGATVVLLGSPRGIATAAPIAEVQRKGLRVVGAHISALAKAAKEREGDPFRELADRYLAALADGTIDVTDLRGDAVDPREIGLLYDRLAAGEVRTAHLDWRLLPEHDRSHSPRLLALPELPDRSPAVPARPIRATPATGTLRFAAVGVGDIGYRNARAIAAASNAELVVSFDTVASLADDVVRRFGGSAATSIDEAFDRERVDAVFLSVPHDLHAPMVERAAEAGLHVVVEKPLASDIAGAKRAIEATTSAGVALSVCFPFRYEPKVVAARALAEAGALGSVRGATVVFHADKPPAYWAGGYSGRAASDWRSRRDRAGGGVFIMSVTHFVDFLRHVAGAETELVTALGRNDEGVEVEDSISIAVSFAGGGVGTMFGSASTPGAPSTTFEMWGDLGTIRLEPEASVFTERAIDGVTPGQWCALPADDGSDPRTIFVERFVDAVVQGREPDVSAADGLAVQAVVEAAYRSMDEGRPVTTAEVLA